MTIDYSRMRIKLKAYDQKILDKAAKEIVKACEKTAAKVIGPIPLPTKISRYTVLRSPHIDKKSREQFEIRIHKRLIDIIQPNENTIEMLKGLELSAGISIEVK